MAAGESALTPSVALTGTTLSQPDEALTGNGSLHQPLSHCHSVPLADGWPGLTEGLRLTQPLSHCHSVLSRVSTTVPLADGWPGVTESLGLWHWHSVAL